MAFSAIKKEAPISHSMLEMVVREVKIFTFGPLPRTIRTSNFEKFHEGVEASNCKNVTPKVSPSTEAGAEKEGKTSIFGVAQAAIKTNNG